MPCPSDILRKAVPQTSSPAALFYAVRFLAGLFGFHVSRHKDNVIEFKRTGAAFRRRIDEDGEHTGVFHVDGGYRPLTFDMRPFAAGRNSKLFDQVILGAGGLVGRFYGRSVCYAMRRIPVTV